MQGDSSGPRQADHPFAAPDRVTIVTGLPRAGTSLVMQVLAAAGLELAHDDARAPDADNPRGYFELSAARGIRDDASFLAACRGRVVKLVVPLVRRLPRDRPARVVFVERALDEVLASQRAMLARRGEGARETDEPALARALAAAVEATRSTLLAAPQVELFSISHRALLEDARRTIASLAEFLRCTAGSRADGAALGKRAGNVRAEAATFDADEDARLQAAMASVIDRGLYRQRGSSANDGR